MEPGHGKLVLNGKSIGNGQTLDFSDTLDVVSITADSLKLGKNGAYRIDYYRVEEVPDSNLNDTLHLQ